MNNNLSLQIQYIYIHAFIIVLFILTAIALFVTFIINLFVICVFGAVSYRIIFINNEILWQITQSNTMVQNIIINYTWMAALC